MDHLPPWLALGAILSTGIYEPHETMLMALPLCGAAWVEWRLWNLGAWRRHLEILALVSVLGLLLLRMGLVPSLVATLFVLCGIRLSLPREPAHRRQVLLMGFLVWITTAISTFEMPFLAWSVLWVAGGAAVLMQQAWEASANLRNGPAQAPPFGKVPLWTLGAVVLSAAFFLVLPRITTGLRFFPWGVAGLTASQAGMSDALDLSGGGPIAPSSDVVLRIIPPGHLAPEERARYQSALALLRGIVLEVIDGQRWDHDPQTFPPSFTRLDAVPPGAFRPANLLLLDYFVAPSPQGVLPLPYGQLGLAPPAGMPIRVGPGGSLRWLFPSRRPIPLQVQVDPSKAFAEPAPGRRRQEILLQTGRDTEAVDRWVRRTVPGDLPPERLAAQLTQALQRFAYTLDNPSGSAVNPLQDFLERTRAGHCEYFASALALGLRYRGVPARVVNGYRLGPWIEEGGYWLVTQNEAHSWVEYYDAVGRTWRTADPTPAAPSAGLSAQTFWAAFQRWTDAVRYRWDRYVVRFSDEDQLAGFEWLREQASSLSVRSPEPRTLRGIASLLLVVAGIWIGYRILRSPRAHGLLEPPGRYGLKDLTPLIRRAQRECPPTAGETVRHWLERLGRAVPERRTALLQLADVAEAVAYDGGNPAVLKAMARQEAKNWPKVRER